MRFTSIATFAFMAASAFAQSPDPSQVYVQSITYGGTGCPNGSVGSSFSNDRKSFTLIFDRFVATSGVSIPVTESRKNCQLNVNLRLPQGFQFSIGTVDYRGYVQLPAGMSAEQKSIYYFQGATTSSNSGTTFTGPVSKDYLVRDVQPITTTIWSACSAVVPVNINSQVRLIGPSNLSAQITNDSDDGKVQHVFGLQWQRCEP